MKKDELLAQGLTEEQAKYVMMAAGKDIERHKLRINELSSAYENATNQLKSANDTLQKFDGMDPAKMKQEIAEYKKAAEQAELTYRAQLQERDQRDWLNKKFDAYGVASPYARKQLIADAMSKDSGLSWKGEDGFFGFDDFMKNAKKQDASLYLTDEEKAAAGATKPEAEKPTGKPAPSFVRPTGDNAGTSERKSTPPKLF